MLVAGYFSDRMQSFGRGIISILFMMFLIMPLMAFWLMYNNSYLYCSILLFMIGFFLFGPQMLIGCVAVEKSHKQAAGTSSGFAGAFGYLGAAVAGYPFGVMLDQMGWDGFFMALLISAFLGALCFLPFIPTLTKPQVVAKI